MKQSSNQQCRNLSKLQSVYSAIFHQIKHTVQPVNKCYPQKRRNMAVKHTWLSSRCSSGFFISNHVQNSDHSSYRGHYSQVVLISGWTVLRIDIQQHVVYPDIGILSQIQAVWYINSKKVILIWAPDVTLTIHIQIHPEN